MNWFLYDNGLRHERVKGFFSKYDQIRRKLLLALDALRVQLFSTENSKI